MATTYTPIATTTLGSPAASVTFSSISGTYTDLILVLNCSLTSGTGNAAIQFNSDTGNNYSFTSLGGSGTAAVSSRNTGASSTYLSYYGYLTQTWQNYVTQIMNYSNSTTYTTLLSRANNTDNGTNANVGLWRNTSAVTSVTVIAALSSSTFIAGSTFTLYGVKSA